MNTVGKLSVLFAVMCGAFGSGMVVSQAQESKAPDLRQGGYVIYFRHAQASKDVQPDAALPAQLKTCKGERHLTGTGVTAMTMVGDNFRSMKIPVGKVISSPACTAMQTAWYVAKSPMEVVSALDGNPREQIWIELRPFLTDMPAKGSNTLVFAHSTNIKALTGFAIAEGEAVIFQPDGQGGFTFVKRMKQDEWGAMTRQ